MIMWITPIHPYISYISFHKSTNQYKIHLNYEILMMKCS